MAGLIVSKKVSVGGKFWINSGLAEEVQSDGCLIKNLVPFADRKLGSVVEKPKTKWFLKFQIARSAVLQRSMWGGANW